MYSNIRTVASRENICAILRNEYLTDYEKNLQVGAKRSFANNVPRPFSPLPGKSNAKDFFFEVNV